MTAIFIESDNIRSLKLLAGIAEELGVTVNRLSKKQAENILLRKPIKKKSNKADHKLTASVLKSADVNPFPKLRKRLKVKMTGDQIDEQMKSLRREWERDI